jgi:hypothetical protein
LFKGCFDIAIQISSCYNTIVKDGQFLFDERRFFMRLSDSIEQFIKTMLTQEEQEVELKRNELAKKFGLPSGMTPNALLEALQVISTYEEYLTAVGRKGN